MHTYTYVYIGTWFEFPIASYVMAHDNDKSDSDTNCPNLSDGALAAVLFTDCRKEKQRLTRGSVSQMH